LDLNLFIFASQKHPRMKRIFTLISISLITFSAFAQTTISNAGFEMWGNASPGVAGEPTGWYSNKSGSSIATLANAICFKDNAVVHTGTASVRVETINYLGNAVNGAVTTGVINAPTFTKTDGYIGTINYSTATDKRYMNFTGRPDSLVGYYQYLSGGAGEQGKIRAILHTSEYFDPETPLTYHAACATNKIADALFLGSTSTFATWKRFSVPFVYVSASVPTHIMINVTSSANQSTTIVGSKLWLDDIGVIYNSTKINEINKDVSIKVFSHDKTVFVDFTNRNEDLANLIIFDLTGKQVASFKVEASKVNSFDVSNLNSGLFLYQVIGPDYKKSGKFIIE
jgi:hypothetical protein